MLLHVMRHCRTSGHGHWPRRPLGRGLFQKAVHPLSQRRVRCSVQQAAKLIKLRSQGFTVGVNATAAVYGGISPARITIITTLLSGALAGGLAVNVILGEEHRLILEYTAGFGFVGIAVALMGRAHPVGIILAAILFGVLYQGGAELAFDKPKISRDMIIVIQGLVVLFAGALEHMFRRPVAVLLARRTTQPPI